MRHFQIFDAVDSFFKKVDYVFEDPLNLHIIIG